MDGGGPAGHLDQPDGRSWTLAAHGITPQQPGDQMEVLTNTPDGFLAGWSKPPAAGNRR